MQNHNPNRDVEVPQAPNDGVSCLAFSSKANFLIAGSWDNQVRLLRSCTRSPRSLLPIPRYDAGKLVALGLPPKQAFLMMHRFYVLLGVG